MFISV
jgi:aspartate beta-hydroxylase